MNATPFETAGIPLAPAALDLGWELRRRYSLTRSEANVALLLAEGLSYAEVAGRLEVSYHTVHTHVKAIHEKTSVKTNGRLLALIHGIGGAGMSRGLKFCATRSADSGQPDSRVAHSRSALGL